MVTSRPSADAFERHQQTTFQLFFWPYMLGGVVWLAVGLAPVAVEVFPTLRNSLLSWADAASTPAVAAVLARVVVLKSYQSIPDSLFLLQCLFSALNLALGAFLAWLRPANRAAQLLALGMVGTAAIFNLQAHAAWDVPLLGTLHEPFHMIAGMAYVYALALFPDGKLFLEWPRPRWFALPLLILYILLFLVALPIAGLALAYVINGEPAGLVLFFGVLIPIAGISSQALRARYAATPEERQQSRLLVWALALAFGLALLFATLTPLTAGLSYPIGTGRPLLESRRPVFLVFTPLFAVIPVTLFVVILRYRLWDVEIIIRRTLIYGALIGALALVYVGGVALLQALSQLLTGPQSDLAIVATTLAIALLFNPLRRRVQELIDRRFYREKVDFRQAFTDFAREVRTIIELPELLRALVHRTTDLLHIAHGAVFLRDASGQFQLAEARHLPSEASTALSIDTDTLDRLQEAVPIARPNERHFPLLVPLIAPEAGGHAGELPARLIGVLALGPRLSDQRYSHEDQTLLTGLADQAGTAIYVAKLIEEKHAEAQRREETERQLEARRNSPIGRAEVLAQAMLAQPHRALIALHRLATRAGQDPAAAQMLEHLPRALGALDSAAAPVLTGCATGFRYLFFSQSEPELVTVGVRALIAHLEPVVRRRIPSTEARLLSNVCGHPQQTTDDERSTTDQAIEGAYVALALYQLCAHALDANSIARIIELLPHLPRPQARGAADDRRPRHFLTDLQRALAELHAVGLVLRAYERVEAPQDRLAYLAGAIERLSHLDRLARAELGGADRPLVQRIAEQWLAITTGAMSELQTRAQLVCRLLTRHTLQDDVVALVLAIRNDGRGAALNLSIGLAPAPEYTLVDEAAQLDRLAAGEEVQVTLRLRPHLADGASQFRIRCRVRYGDPRGPDQVEHFADEVQLLVAEGAFQFIPNPYVVGTPLQGGSPLFFGRHDLLAFINENLHAAHRNNLVLIGQRRTGKTSLLKQLPARLGDDYLPIYLDGQSLGLDPGLPNFFLALATEIAFALDDRGFSITPPELSDFAESPAAAFERGFLPRVRGAIGDRHLLLLLDEFEELEEAVRRGSLDRSLFSFLRHLIQHAERLSVIFCGTHRLEELAADYWSVLFNISLYRHVGFLERGEAERLIQEPVAPFGMRYDDLALEKIWRITAGHPYFLQLLCHSLVNRHNRSGRGYITVADVNIALDDILAAGEAHFIYLWAESNEDERLALLALSRTVPLTGHTTPAQVEDYLADRGVTVERRAVAAALQRLALRDILTPADDVDSVLGEAYGWRLGLLGLWVEKYRSLSRVVGEVRT